MVAHQEADEPISRISEKDYQDYDSIGGELQRFASLSMEDQLTELRADPWIAVSGFKGPHGHDVPLSQAGQARFTQVARRGLKELGADARIHRLEEVVKALKGELATLVLGNFPMTTENAHQVFDAAVKKLAEGYSDLTHYVPCSVVAQRSYETFVIGPVTFVLRDLFFKQNEAAIQQVLAKVGDGSVGESLLASAHAFYSDFKWIASITVPPCDREISGRRARDGIQKALDVFKLIVGSERASHVKQGHDVRIASRSVDLVSSPTGTFSLRFGTTGQDAITNDEWFTQVTAGPAWPFLQAILLHYWQSWGNVDEIQLRFLDALGWHSDAISETDISSRIIKFWVAIERLLSTSHGDKITTRAAVLASDSVEDFAAHSKELEDPVPKEVGYCSWQRQPHQRVLVQGSGQGIRGSQPECSLPISVCDSANSRLQHGGSSTEARGLAEVVRHDRQNVPLTAPQVNWGSAGGAITGGAAKRSVLRVELR